MTINYKHKHKELIAITLCLYNSSEDVVTELNTALKSFCLENNPEKILSLYEKMQLLTEEFVIDKAATYSSTANRFLFIDHGFKLIKSIKKFTFNNSQDLLKVLSLAKHNSKLYGLYSNGINYLADNLSN